MCRGSSIDEQKFDATCQSDDVPRASDDSISDDVSAEIYEMDDKEPEDGPYEVDLNRISTMLTENHRLFEKVLTQNVHGQLKGRNRGLRDECNRPRFNWIHGGTYSGV